MTLFRTRRVKQFTNPFGLGEQRFGCVEVGTLGVAVVVFVVRHAVITLLIVIALLVFLVPVFSLLGNYQNIRIL